MKPILHIALALILSLTGCATYAQFSGDFRADLAGRNYDGALAHLDDAKKSGNRLLYLLENGLIAHNQGRYETSNRYFEEAERVSDQLFTRSISREAAALLTNDAVRHYRGDSFELVAIHYYRALNYWRLGQPESALVECRKANLKLAQYAIHNGEKTYKNDAFIHYMTGLFYEATGELNDAYISYQHAAAAYAHYAGAFDFAPPAMLQADLARVERILHGEGPDWRLASLHPAFFLQPAGPGELIVFSEIGFVPRKIQNDIDLPIYSNDISRGHKLGATVIADDIAHRHGRAYYRTDTVDYWLRVALPQYETATPRTRRIHIRANDRSIDAIPAQNYAAIARASLDDRYPAILTRTVARSFAKYLTYRKAKDESKVLGFLANLFNVATEIADTRSWVSLPHSIHIGRLDLDPGAYTITLEARDAGGSLIESKTFENIEIKPGQRTFLNHRIYQ